MLNQLIAIARLVPQEEDDRNRNHNHNNNSTGVAAAINKATSIFRSLFTHICILLAVARFCAFSLVSRRIYASAPELWTPTIGMRGGLENLDTRLGLVKNKLVIGYFYVEVLFSCWVRLLK